MAIRSSSPGRGRGDKVRPNPLPPSEPSKESNFTNMLRLSLVVMLLAGSLGAQQPSEPGVKQFGVVRALGRFIPGATVTASQGDHKVVSTTDEAGHYELDGLTRGDWTIKVEMVAFAPASKQRTMEDLAPPPL